MKKQFHSKLNARPYSFPMNVKWNISMQHQQEISGKQLAKREKQDLYSWLINSINIFSLVTNNQHGLLTATEEKFMPTPPWQIVWILLAALHTVEPSTKNVATRRPSIFKRGIFKDIDKIIISRFLRFNQQTVRDHKPGAKMLIK